MGREVPRLSADALVKWMDAHHVAKAVVLPLVSPESSSYLNLTEQAHLRLRNGIRTGLIPFCCIDPAHVVPGRAEPACGRC